jgi:hypothetical protein
MRKLLLLAALAAAATPALAANLPDDLAKAAHDYDQAQIKSDKAELTRLLADDYLLQNSSGQVQDKASFIADSTAPGFRIEPFVIEEPVEKLLGDTALLGGVSVLRPSAHACVSWMSGPSATARGGWSSPRPPGRRARPEQP